MITALYISYKYEEKLQKIQTELKKCLTKKIAGNGEKFFPFFDLDF